MTRKVTTALTFALCLAGLVAPTAASGDPSATHQQSARDGQLVFTRYDETLDDNVAIVVNPDGTGEHQPYPFAMECPRWSPDGTQIASWATRSRSPAPDGPAAAEHLAGARGRLRFAPTARRHLAEVRRAVQRRRLGRLLVPGLGTRG
jgi:hypothetical protein